MSSYDLEAVEKMLRLPRSTIRALIKAGFVTPEPGPKKSVRFSFQDLIVLRTAQALADAKVPSNRITRSLKALRQQLPDEMPLSGLSIGAVGDQVVVRDAVGQRRADTGQYLLAFEGDPTRGSLSVIERRPVPEPELPEPAANDEGFERAAALEHVDPAEALKLYEKLVAEEPDRLEARINLGRLLHEMGKLAQAERVYREARERGGEDPVLLFNMGVLFEDLNRRGEAAMAYQAALRADPRLADGHYNLALLCEKLGRRRDAIRHMAEYRKLGGE